MAWAFLQEARKLAAVQPSGREDRGIREPVLWEKQKGMMVPAAALGRTEIPGKAEGIPEKGLEVTWRPGIRIRGCRLCGFARPEKCCDSAADYGGG